MITFNGRSSDDFGIVVQYHPNDMIPSLCYESVKVAGRNGELHFSEHSYANVTRHYEIFLNTEADGFASGVRGLAEWLCSADGYCRLTDSYDPTVFYLARYLGGTEVENKAIRYGTAEIEFDCYPQKFLLSGETVTTIATSGAVINNPSYCASKPLLEVTCSGDGLITIGDKTLTIADIDDTFFLDCDIEEAFTAVDNYNSNISGSYPVLTSGNNTITFSGDITEIKITPRWWKL